MLNQSHFSAGWPDPWQAGLLALWLLVWWAGELPCSPAAQGAGSLSGRLPRSLAALWFLKNSVLILPIPPPPPAQRFPFADNFAILAFPLESEGILFQCCTFFHGTENLVPVQL